VAGIKKYAVNTSDYVAIILADVAYRLLLRMMHFLGGGVTVLSFSCLPLDPEKCIPGALRESEIGFRKSECRLGIFSLADIGN
jgi:hypothetical protein